MPPQNGRAPARLRRPWRGTEIPRRNRPARPSKSAGFQPLPDGYRKWLFVEPDEASCATATWRLPRAYCGRPGRPPVWLIEDALTRAWMEGVERGRAAARGALAVMVA